MEVNNTGADDFLIHDEDIFRTLIQESPLPVGLYTGHNMEIRVVNDAILKVWSKDKSVIGKPFSQALPELQGQPFFKLLDDVYATGIAYEAKEDLVRLLDNGQLKDFYFNFTYKPLKTPGGQVWGIINTATDVTDLVLTRKKLEEVEKRNRFALDAADMGTWDLDLINNLVVWDDRCKELFGFNKHERVGYADVLKFIHPDDSPHVNIAVNNAINPELQENYDVTFRTIGNGVIRWLRCKGKAHFNEHNKAYRFAGTAVDITTEINSKDEQQKLLFLIENSSDSISLTDWEGYYTYINKAGLNILGFDNLEQAASNVFSALMPNEVSKAENVIFPEMVKNGRWAGEVIYKHAVTGEPIPAWINSLLIKDPLTGNPLGRATVVRDMRAEMEARQEQQKLITVVENSADLIVVADIGGKIVYINQAGMHIMGAKSIEECYRHSIDYFMPGSVPLLARKIGPALREKGEWAGEVNYRDFKTGEAIPVWLNCFTLTDQTTGELLGHASVTRDMRAEKASQLALAQSEELFRKITIAAPAALWMTDTNSMVTYVNQVWIDWTGYPLELQMGTGWLNAVVSDDRETAAYKLINDIAERRFHESHFRIQHANGQLRYIICTGNPQYDAADQYSGYIGACVDITELKQLQRQKDDFIGIASHELKTPVTSIKAYTQFLESILRRKGDLKEAEMIHKMDLQINRLTILIEDLLDVTKITSGRLQFHQSWFDFNRMMEEVVEDLQRTTATHALIEDFKANTQVYADKDRIGQVLINLITNAIKYSPEAEEIIIRSTIKNNEVEVCVQDFGIGISSDKVDKVFEQFYRVSGDKEHTFPGLGLGLYISSEIIKREGGHIWVNSIEGKGSTFCFSLPINRQS